MSLGRHMHLLAGIAVLALATPAAAAPPPRFSLQEAIGNPDDFHISGSARQRYEAIGGQFRPGLADQDDIIVLRTMLLAEYRPGPVRVGVELSDSRAYSTRSDGYLTTSEVNALEPIQAYVAFDLGDALGGGTRTSLTAGRFTLAVGSGRLVTRNNFRNTINAFTGFKASVAGTTSGRELTLFYTLPLQRLPEDKASLLDNDIALDRESFDLALWGAHLATPVRALDATAESYFYALNEQDMPRTATRDRQLYTPGVRISRKPKAGRLDFDLEAALQFGTVSASTAPGAQRQDVFAGVAHAELGYRFPGSWAPRLSVLYDFGSGDRPGGKQTRFDPLYGSRRSDFGNTSLFGALSRSNLSSAGMRLEAQPPRAPKVALLYRLSWLDSATDSFAATGVRDADGDAGGFAGHLLDLRVTQDLVPEVVTLEAGGTLLLNGRFLDDAANANRNGDTRYGFVQITTRF